MVAKLNGSISWRNAQGLVWLTMPRAGDYLRVEVGWIEGLRAEPLLVRVSASKKRELNCAKELRWFAASGFPSLHAWGYMLGIREDTRKLLATGCGCNVQDVIERFS